MYNKYRIYELIKYVKNIKKNRLFEFIRQNYIKIPLI